jgi:ElaB/YqjD/DUF883 family membrane-anchored ribosome-binding protein
MDQNMAATHGRDVALDTVKNDLAALQREIATVKRRSFKAVEQRVTDQPVQSMLIAFAAGLICSKLLLRRLF